MCIYSEKISIWILHEPEASITYGMTPTASALLRARNRQTMALPLSALHMKASGSYKIQVKIHWFVILFVRLKYKINKAGS